jgi:hypothetical protein
MNLSGRVPSVIIYPSLLYDGRWRGKGEEYLNWSKKKNNNPLFIIKAVSLSTQQLVPSVLPFLMNTEYAAVFKSLVTGLSRVLIFKEQDKKFTAFVGLQTSLSCL